MRDSKELVAAAPEVRVILDESNELARLFFCWRAVEIRSDLEV